MVLEIRTFDDPVLRRKSKAVTKIGPRIRALLDEMAETMYKAEGVGLAAPQVGISKRIIVVDVGEGLLELINPEVTVTEGRQAGTEGCLSLPGLIGEVVRAERATIEGQDRRGRKVWVEADGLLARALLHEIDHLDGVLFTDRALRVEKIEVDGDQETGKPGPGGEKP